MRRIILYINSTFNGIVTGDPSKDKTNFMAWTTEEALKTGVSCALESMQTVDTLLLGRRTYEDLSRHEKWPSVMEWPGTDESTLALGEKINNAVKFVVSKAHPDIELQWGKYRAPTLLTGNDVVNQIAKIRNSSGGDIVIFGSPTLVRSLTDANLIDEFHIQVRPVVANVGEHLFDGLKTQKDFQLIESRALSDGTVFIKYKLVGR